MLSFGSFSFPSVSLFLSPSVSRSTTIAFFSLSSDFSDVTYRFYKRTLIIIVYFDCPGSKNEFRLFSFSSSKNIAKVIVVISLRVYIYGVISTRYVIM